MSKFMDSHFEAAVEVVDISYNSIDGAAIAGFLKNTPRLKKLTYLHKAGVNVGFQDWDLCQFIMAIETKVESHLEELSIRIGILHGPIVPGRVSMRGFRNLQNLDFHLKLQCATLHLLHWQSLNCFSAILYLLRFQSFP